MDNIIHQSLDGAWKLAVIHHKDFVKIALPVLYDEVVNTDAQGAIILDAMVPGNFEIDLEKLVKHFGGRLNFRGCISTAGALAYGSVRDVEEVCKKTLEIMMTARGYHFAPTHMIQDNTPVENVIAMYQSAHNFGGYI